MSGFLTPQALAAGKRPENNSLNLLLDQCTWEWDIMGLILIVAGPLVLETFFKHYLFRNPLKHEGQAREDLMYDEGESPAST